jgi:hypothetical protein
MAALIANMVGLVSQILTSHKYPLDDSHSSRSSKYKLPYPRTPHLVFGDDVIRGRRIVIIGDVHGCLEELDELLEDAKSRCGGQQILPVFVGDLLTKGPHPLETMTRLHDVEHFAVRGNHDEAVLKQALLFKQSSGMVDAVEEVPLWTWFCQATTGLSSWTLDTVTVSAIKRKLIGWSLPEK